MADPIQVVSSLDTLADHYAVFEPDQVLTHGQLNSVSDFLGDQLRLSRVALDGVGLIHGLHVALVDGGVRVTRGLGVSTDGDLMVLPADTSYDRFRAYDETAPLYRPFFRGTASDGTPTDMIALHELVPVGESDVLARPLADLPGGLAGKAVLMLMETVVNDPDLCAGTDCDNLGRDALHRMRMMLIDRGDAQALLERRPLRPASERAQALAEVAVRRPVLARDITTTALLAARYRSAAQATQRDLLRALPALAAHCPEVLQQVFGADPTPRWRAALATITAGFAGTSSGLQVWYDFIGELVATWNELREALLDDDAVALPDVAAFPKHLLLGALAAPREQRTALYPSPLDAQARQRAAHARFLAWKFEAQINAFELPADAIARITPSAGDDAPLERRAIPWHYALREAQPIHVAWNYRLSARNQSGHNLGYRAADWATTARARDPLRFAIAGHDFFRIEGHLGRPVEAVGAELRKLIADRNLPLRVQEVLLHNDRKRIRVRPPLRYTPLHGLHYLIRQDVAWRLNESKVFGQAHVTEVTTAVDTKQVPPTTDSGASVVTLARQAVEAVGSVQAASKTVLSARSYSSYKSATQGDGGKWKSSYATSLESLSQTRASLGHVSRVDFTSPYDSLIVSNQPHWIDWLDDLIQAQDDRADERLLYSRFVQEHPGLDHLGGAWRGGTFVLVYDDAGRVVADFALPYLAAEAEADEPEEPPLTKPPYRPPLAVAGGIRVIRPVELKVQDRVLIERQVFDKEVQSVLEKQTANINGLVQGAFVPNNAVAPKPPTVELATSGDRLLDAKARDLAWRRDHVLELQNLLSQPELDHAARAGVEADLARAQGDLADAIAGVAGGLLRTKSDVPADASLAIGQQLTGSVALIQDRTAKAALGERLKQLEGEAGTGGAVLIGNLRTVGGLR